MSAGMTGYLYQRRLPAANWISAVEEAHTAAAFVYLYAEEAATIHLTWYRRPEAHWTHVRAFGPAAEVRWLQRRDGQVDLILLTEKPVSLNGWQLADDTLVCQDSQVILRGVSRRHNRSPYPKSQDAPQEWTDSRIPQPLAYPVVEAQAVERWVKLKTKTYQANGRPILTRLVALEGSSDEQKL
ncbi:MAG: hypothetical protein AB1801_13930 [Chloroflexota bacterium]